MNSCQKLLGIVAALCAALAAPGAQAQTCQPGDTQEALQYLRRLSLDLRGRLPSYPELEAVVARGEVDPALIDQMLASGELVQQIARQHRDLLWVNVTDQQLAGNSWRLRGPGNRGGEVVPAYFVNFNGRSARYRGAQVSCLDEPARFDANNFPLTTPDPNDPNIQREGWVEVTPYWSPSTPIKVCAFDAQTNLTALDDRGNMVDCSQSPNSRACGCGPNLQWCESQPDQTRLTVLDSLAEQLLRFSADIVGNDRPYTDLLLAKDMEINGPISHFLRLQAQTTQGNGLLVSKEQNYAVPEISFAERDRWTQVQRGERHAGVLTMPAYLVKFASDRGRAHRFYNAFLCQEFEAQNPIPPASDPCHAEPDLTKRCGCKDCHVAVEPAAAYWGRWAEAALVPLNSDIFPKLNTCCLTGGSCSPQDRRLYTGQLCRRLYFTEADLTGPDDPSRAYLGMLRSYVFADAVREASIETGPEGIARQAIDSGAFARCTSQRMWTKLMAREPSAEESAAIDELAAGFAQGYNFRALLKTIVTRPEYVQAGRYDAAQAQ